MLLHYLWLYFLMLWHNYALLAYSCILLNAYAYVCFLHHLLLNLLLGVHHQSIIFHTQTIKVTLTNLRKCCCGTNILLYFVCFLSYTWPPAFLSPPLTWSKGKIFVSINMNHGYVTHQFFFFSFDMWTLITCWHKIYENILEFLRFIILIFALLLHEIYWIKLKNLV